MGNCLCMQGPGHGSRSKKRAISGGGDSVKHFLDNAATIHPLAADDPDEDHQTVAAAAARGLEVVRVKLVVTKAEVAHLLASRTIVAATPEKMSPGASVLELLAGELQSLSSADQVHSQQICCGSCAWKPALESIPEVM